MMRNSKPIEFDIDVAENTPMYLLGDELRVKQILNNLLSNAFKYTEEGTIKLTVYIEECKGVARNAPTGARNAPTGAQNAPTGGDTPNKSILLVIKVSDTGRGLTKEQIERIFEEYTRFNTDANRPIEGVGLGMSITKRLVSMMDGKIFIESEPHKGSTFTVHLPQGVVGDKVIGKDVAQSLRKFRINAASQLKRSQILREPMPYGSVLIVDDVASNLYVAKGLMLPYGLAIETVSGGASAIERVKGGKVYDVIFMDHMMAGMDGIEAVKILRELGYNNPIVALTANAVVGQAEMFLKNGFDAFISKPIDIRQLNAVLNKYIRDRQPVEVVQKARRQSMMPHHAAVPETDSTLQEVFLLDAKKSLPIIEGTLQNIETATDEDFRLFAINAHAMKSALANINESIVSQRAFVLEKAGREKDTDVIKAQTKIFIDEVKKIAERFEADRGNLETDIKEDTNFLRQQMQIIRKACEDYDERPIITSLEALKKLSWKKETRTLIDKISEHALFSAFDEAGSLAAEYLNA
jgi:CheY-like chemotaxis protein/HPt (histidine-containing phosphotransfer) domain-containing protein